MKELLSRLDVETLILDLKEDTSEIKPLEGYGIIREDARTLRVDLSRNQNLNNLIIHLNNEGIEVLSMRNRTGRLEELFLELTQKK